MQGHLNVKLPHDSLKTGYLFPVITMTGHGLNDLGLTPAKCRN